MKPSRLALAILLAALALAACGGDGEEASTTTTTTETTTTTTAAPTTPTTTPTTEGATTCPDPSDTPPDCRVTASLRSSVVEFLGQLAYDAEGLPYDYQAIRSEVACQPDGDWYVGTVIACTYPLPDTTTVTAEGRILSDFSVELIG